MGGDKIVLLDGAGANGGGAATNGLLSMIPGMFANLIGGNKMDPNLVAALMNGRNNQDGFGGANGWWLWIKAVRDFQSKSKTERDSYCLICGCTGGCNLCDDISKYRISEQLKYYK